MRCRRPSISLSTEWFDAANQLPDKWDLSLAEDAFLQRKNLLVQETCKAPYTEMRYAMLLAGDEVLAQAAFQLLTVRPEHIKQGSLPAWQFRLWKAFTRTVKPRLLVAGQLFRHDVVSIAWSELMKPYDVFVWYRDAIEQLAGKTHSAAVLLKELPEALVPHFLHNAPGYLLLRNDISMQLAIPPEWRSMKDYERSLKHKYAQRFRKVQQSWAALQVKEMNAEEVTGAAASIYSLYLQVTEHQPVRMGLLSEEFIPTLKSAYPDRLKVWGIWEGDVMVAFASGWVSADRFDMFYIGFDYARNAGLNLYFNILFFAVEQAIVLQKPTLILGRTALEAKARVGCTPEYLNTFLFIRNPLLRSIVTRLQSRLGESSNEWEQRHPFKQS